MTYQSNLNIKAEPFSPTAQNDILATAGSTTASRPMTRGGTPTKRPKSETRDLQASTPETKKKLQSAVLDRRKANGFTGIPNNLFEKPKVSQLTKADIEKREKRKEQNRKAAKKCRAKKKELQDKTEKETAQYAESNVQMQQRLQFMYQRLLALAVCFSQHLNCGDCTVPLEVKEKDRQFISETFEILESCTKMCLPQEEPASVAGFNVDHNDASQLSSISDNYTSISEASSSTHFNHSMDTPALLSFDELGNLPSSDLEDINPDIPLCTFSKMDTDKSLRSVDDFKPTTHTQNNYNQSSFNDLYLSPLLNDAFIHGLASTTESHCLKAHKTAGVQEENDISVLNSPRSSDHHNRVVTTMVFKESGTVGFSTSPNFTQPNSTSLRSVQSPMVSETAQGNMAIRLHATNKLYQVSADDNNNGGKQSPGSQIGENYNVCVGYPGIGSTLSLNHANISSSSSPAFFTFEDDPSSPLAAGPIGDEPISPFFTQGGCRRM